MSYDRKGLLNRLKQFEQGKSRPPKEGEEFNPNISYGIWDAINLHTVLDTYKYRGEGEAVNIDSNKISRLMWDAIEKHKSITNGAEALIYVETSAERIFAKYKELYNSFYEDIGQYLDKKGKERSLANYVNEDLYNFWILYLRCVSKVRPKKQRLIESFSEFTARHSNNDL